MTLQAKITKIRDALTSIDGLTVYHYWRFVDNPPCAIWQEDTESGYLQADLRKREQGVGGTVDYFTQTEYDTMTDAIQDALNDIENCFWNLEDVQYEEDTRLIHYTWRWRLL